MCPRADISILTNISPSLHYYDQWRPFVLDASHIRLQRTALVMDYDVSSKLSSKGK